MTWPWVSRDRYNRCESQAWYWYLKSERYKRAFNASEREIAKLKKERDKLKEELEGIEGLVDYYSDLIGEGT